MKFHTPEFAGGHCMVFTLCLAEAQWTSVVRMDMSFTDQEGHGAEQWFSSEASQDPLESVCLGCMVKLTVIFLALLSGCLLDTPAELRPIWLSGGSGYSSGVAWHQRAGRSCGKWAGERPTKEGLKLGVPPGVYIDPPWVCSLVAAWEDCTWLLQRWGHRMSQVRESHHGPCPWDLMPGSVYRSGPSLN